MVFTPSLRSGRASPANIPQPTGGVALYASPSKATECRTQHEDYEKESGRIDLRFTLV
jgi:hypothetical protein